MGCSCIVVVPLCAWLPACLILVVFGACHVKIWHWEELKSTGFPSTERKYHLMKEQKKFWFLVVMFVQCVVHFYNFAP